MADKQGELFPEDKPKKKPSTTTPEQKAAAQQRKKKRAERKTRIQGGRMEEEARRREWERRKARGEVFGDMPDNFLLEWSGETPDPSQGVAGDAFTVLDALSIQKNVLKGAGSLLIKNIGNKFKNKLRIKPDMYNDLGVKP